MRYFVLLVLIASTPFCARSQTAGSSRTENTVRQFTMDSCVNEFSAARIESTKAGYQYWFVDRHFLDGRTIKLSVVRPHGATHPPHAHPEDEFFFVLEGTAEFHLAGETRVAGPYTSFYCPPSVPHGIRNAGDKELKYLVIKKYRTE
jgi:mannose-6-phosphate isomerase-like protein (cupin superfamily)